MTQPHLDPTGDEAVFEAYAAESPPADHLPSGRARTVFLTVLTLICLLLYGVGALGLFPPQAQWPTWLAVDGPVTALLAATCLVVTMVRAHAGAASDRPAQIAHVLLGIGWILFSWTLVTDLLLRLPLLFAGVGKPLRSRLVAVVLAVTTVALALWGHLEARRVPRVRRVDIPIQRPSGDADGLTIGVLTDTRFDSFKTPAWSRGVVAALNAHGVVANRIVLAGVDDPTGNGTPGHGTDLDAALAGAPDLPIVLLAHQPHLVALSRDRVDLQISGHTHGGQMWPFHHLVRLREPLVQGLSRHGKRTQGWTSRGTGYWGPPFRVFAPSEIWLIRLVRARASA